MKSVQVFALNDSGVTSIEYALIAALIFLVIIEAVTLLGHKVVGLYTDVDAGMS